jgi:replicative DNA helicase
MTELEKRVSELSSKKKDNYYPFDAMVEMSLLGTILLGGKKVLDDVEHIVNEQMFYRPGNQAIYSSMKRVVAQTQGSCDIVLLNEDLTNHNQIDLIGGLAYLFQLGDMEFTTVNAVTYANRVKRCHELRNIVVNAEYAMLRAQQGDVDPETISLDFAKGTEVKTSTNTVSSAGDVLRESISSILSGRKKGIPTGFADIDNVINGFKEGELIILGGRPSMGKSSLGLQYAINASRYCKTNGGGALYISVEMSQDMISQRLLQIIGNVDGQAIYNSYFSKSERDSMESTQSHVDTLPLFFSTETPVTIQSIRAKARDMQRKGVLSILVVDYLQMLDTGKETQGRTRDIGVLSRGLKSIAKEFNIPVIALSSLSRASEQRNDKRPIMSDLRESGDIESDADVVQFLYRPDYYSEDRNSWDENIPSETEVITAKNRNGSIGVSRIEFHKSVARFADIPQGSL